MDGAAELGSAQARDARELAAGRGDPAVLGAGSDTWGELQARAERRGRARPVNDTWIAACCLVRGHPLATLNVKDYADFAQHEGLQLLTP